MNSHQIETFIWQIADLLRGPYRPPQYERVMLPMTVLRRFDCVLQPTKSKVLAEYERIKDRLSGPALDSRLNSIAGKNFRFHNHSRLDFEKLKGDPDNIAQHLNDYINGFSENVRTIFDRFEFAREIEQLNRHNLLYLIVSKFCDVDLHPDLVDNIAMGTLFEHLIRRFNEAANETAGDHFTPREVIQLMVDILFAPDGSVLTEEGKVFTLLDPACGTGGMLSEAQRHLAEMNSRAQLWVYGQDFNPRSYAIAQSDLLLKIGAEDNSDRKINMSPKSEIRFGDSLIDDHYPGERFDYFLANPPFGVDWKAQQAQIVDEKEKLGDAGRFGAGLPRVNDGALLFLQHMVSKFEVVDLSANKNGARLAIVFNGSPLFTGGPRSGESDIRKWLIEERDHLEAVIALPDQLFYNTGISTYIWIVTNRKEEHRKGKIQLVDARECFYPMRRSLGNKRNYIGEDHIEIITRFYGESSYKSEAEVCISPDGEECQRWLRSKMFSNTEFGYKEVTIERPLRLLYRMDVERKSRFLDAYPELLDDIQAIDQQLGRQDRNDWYTFLKKDLEPLLKTRSSKWKKKALTDFRDVFTEASIDGVPVIAEIRSNAPYLNPRVWGWFHQQNGAFVTYEPDSQLRDRENVPLEYQSSKIQGIIEDSEHPEVVDYFLQEVEPYVEDAWAERQKVQGAYEINFNRYFYQFKAPRSIEEIDVDIEGVRESILKLLNEVMQ